MKEIARDEQGNILWEGPYLFKRLSAKGEYIVDKGVPYVVISSKVEDDTVNSVLRRETRTRAVLICQRQLSGIWEVISPDGYVVSSWLRKDQAELAAAQWSAPAKEPTPPLHVYLSTACHHAYHDACRKQCKFCAAQCSCQCHSTTAT